MVGALTVVLSQIGQYMWGRSDDDIKETTNKQEKTNVGSTITEYD
jgi:hypothetical protein